MNRTHYIMENEIEYARKIASVEHNLALFAYFNLSPYFLYQVNKFIMVIHIFKNKEIISGSLIMINVEIWSVFIRNFPFTTKWQWFEIMSNSTWRFSDVNAERCSHIKHNMFTLLIFKYLHKKMTNTTVLITVHLHNIHDNILRVH